ncbi:hypothetical protein [Mucilaginibacter humi]|uniref:hypothetical protein n=1 Tax=Mucilaginibacter humi TaxID=2732510 RepID=UPI001FE9C46D|nr:hypothetical protein [Mucilaginibacter humi]
MLLRSLPRPSAEHRNCADKVWPCFAGEVAKGMTVAAKEMETAHMDTSVILFTMWTESIKHFAENSEGNVIFLDGSTDSMQRTMKEMMSLNVLQPDKVKK